ncbi:hypothetical protein HD553DRAFT_305089 [Filobasidium floriforme]|uniref:uncharacterized protein n=1 Tax=Filobasidium floriforme TaxID=5210 RepID=UPI001E8D5CAC|nr:uncharacterized protein HD553DRAFT_305089 [Filobasidium floriforme]KAH8089072.1 hypothetical protein HD553DRAFT_305089 [Filobasidium floriforme]
MPDLRALARSCPPASIADDLLAIINAQLRSFLTAPDPKETSDDVLQYVAIGLNIHASRSLRNLGTLPPVRVDLLPLEALVKLVDLAPDALDDVLPTFILDAILAYPTHVSTVRQLVTSALKDNAAFGTALKQEVIEATVRLLERENSRVLKCEKGQDPGESHIPRLAYSLFIYARAHPNMAAAIVEARNFFGILKVSYEVVSGLPLTSLDATRKIQTKSHLLLLLHTLLEPLPPSDREWKLEMIDEHGENEGSDTLVNTGICHDYNVLFAQQDGQAAMDLSSGESGKQAIGEKQMDALRSLSSGMKLHTHREDESVMIKHRIAPILVLFPDMPPELLHEALRHPRFAHYKSENGGEDDPVTVLTNAMLDSTLPSELKELGRRVRAVTQGEEREGASRNASAEGSRERSRQPSPEKTARKTFKRDNIFNDMPMDFSKLSFGKGKNDDDLDSYTNAVPDHIRQSIIRLTEQQRSEEEAERELEHEEAKARRSRSAVAGPSKAKEPRIRTVAFEEELDEDDLLDDETDALEARVRLNLREGEEGSSDGESYVNSEEDDDVGAGGTEDVYLEQLYLQNPSAFERNAATRRSKMREQMRQQTGWSDEQLEGWKIMLERNPLKDKILSRHGDPRGNRAPADRSGNQPNRGGGGGGGARGGGHGDRGRGGSGGGRGGGGGRGRGGANKSSRGHQNAARTRGHDRKMAKMGAA